MKDLEKETIVNKKGPVIIIEDDADDQDFLTEIFQKLNYPNEILFFFDGQEALDHINSSKELPFLILSDINMPKLNGFELREKLRTDTKLSNKCIPYLFFSTAANQKAVIDAYSQSVQGFFLKQNSMTELEWSIGGAALRQMISISNSTQIRNFKMARSIELRKIMLILKYSSFSYYILHSNSLLPLGFLM